MLIVISNQITSFVCLSQINFNMCTVDAGGNDVEIRRSTAVQWTLQWRRLHSSDLCQRPTVRATRLTFVSSGVRRYHTTFRVMPSLFYQLFTVFVQHTDHSFPVLYALMTRRTTALYQRRLRKAVRI